MNERSVNAPRWLAVVVGVVMLLPCALFVVLALGANADKGSSLERFVATLLFGLAALFFASLAYRLLLGRPAKDGGLLSPLFLYLFVLGSVGCAAAGLWTALRTRSTGPLGGSGGMLILAGPALALAERRRRIRRAGVDPDRIVPRVWVARSESGTEAGAGGGGGAIRVDAVVRTDILPPPLAVAYAYDRSDDDLAFIWLTRADQARLRLSDDELHELAVSHVESCADEIELHGKGPFQAITCGGRFEAALLLVDAVWNRLEDEGAFAAPAVVAVPSPDLLFVTEPDSGGFSMLRELLDRIEADGNLTLTRQLFVRDGKRWLPFAPPREEE